MACEIKTSNIAIFKASMLTLYIQNTISGVGAGIAAALTPLKNSHAM